MGREEEATSTNEEIAALEKQIEEACELENYDEAGAYVTNCVSSEHDSVKMGYST